VESIGSMEGNLEISYGDSLCHRKQEYSSGRAIYIYINIHSYTCMSIVYSVHICNHVYMYIIMYMYAYIGIDVCAHAPSLHQPTIGTPGDDLQALVV
jgi:hypothetical protein